MLKLEGYPEILEVKDLVAILPLGKDTIYRLAKSQAFPSVRVGSRILVEKDDIKQWWETYKGKKYIL